ncbi:DUF3987 domain-containing protein [Porifericola rhodea]|uniref:DUF3987 domain-containing protein n=1 Tax=Porifericola rhodea TaxID=930972 RepID=UPI0026664F79|nr:DUF3987 domain-containing protein [Porifericola rhodea]WKN29754.1 DUF3987 domain-containing protein [Porifericola rhodea]
MLKFKFNPRKWLDTSNSSNIEQPKQEAILRELKSTYQEVLKVVEQIEAKQIDITSAYEDWRNIGFALADEFGESGRDLFHKISCFYPDYSQSECDKQFEKCLQSKGTGISLKTFFYHAKNAGIKIANAATLSNNQQLPNFTDTVYSNLPEFLQKVVRVANTAEERDILLLGTLTTLSSCFPKLYGIYDGKKVYSNLFLFITAQASAGKGRLVHCKQLVKPIHKEFREQASLLRQRFEFDMSDYHSNKGKGSNANGAEKPSKPPEKMLLIPANNSTTGVFQLLSDNEGRGLIFETEGDTLSQAFKSDYGNYSDGFRKAFHHETISYYRRTDQEYVDIETPCISTVLSGTPKQIATLIPDAENGLFSRFIFYRMNVQAVWKDVFAASSNNGLDKYFDELGKEFHEFYKVLEGNTEVRFYLSVDQEVEFNQFFVHVQKKYLDLLGIDYMATVRRLGLITFRISMILSALRVMETGDISNKLICEERDFQVALSIVKVLLEHSSKVFSELSGQQKPVKKKNRKEMFLANLPQTFNRQQYLEVSQSLSIADKTAEGYIKKYIDNGVIQREFHDSYIKMVDQETKDLKEVE